MNKLNLKIDGFQVYVNTNTNKVKIGAKGPALKLPVMLAVLDKGDRRKLRKALRSAGFAGLAGCVANPSPS